MKEKEIKLMNVILVGAVWVRDQNTAGTRKMFRLGQGACQNNQALVFDGDLFVWDLTIKGC